MAYYFFDKCPEDKLGELEKLCNEIGLFEVKSSSEREWHVGNSEIFWLVRYSPDIVDTPLPLQTMPGKEYRDKAVLEVMKRLLDITDSDQIYSGVAPKKPMNMALFR